MWMAVGLEYSGKKENVLMGTIPCFDGIFPNTWVCGITEPVFPT
jgi:hypothetical protein